MILNDYEVPGSDMEVSVYFRFENEEISGQTSATERTNKGIKPKSLTVSLEIKVKDSDLLTELVSVSTSVDDNNNMLVYDIVDITAKTLQVRQVQFTDSFNVRKVDKIQAWRVSFVLTEYLSVAEKVELRQAQSKIEEQAADGDVVAIKEIENQNKEPQVALTGFEQVLTKLEGVLS
ncbi:MAG: DNA-binding protein [Gammaproteobacteria bacterium]|nr:DNA-binding protein [Gammaproteobacteria bacterium]